MSRLPTFIVPRYIVSTSQLLAIVAPGLMAGFFYAYSVSVMPGLDRLDPTEAIHAMQGINIAVRNAVFMATYAAPPLLGLLAAALTAWQGRRRAALLFAASSAVYGLGVLAPTGSINIPMNQALALLIPGPDRTGLAALWADYSGRWTPWNTLRTLFSLAAMLLALGAARQALRDTDGPNGREPPTGGLGPGSSRRP